MSIAQGFGKENSQFPETRTMEKEKKKCEKCGKCG
jgi:hypothetical protein